MHRNSIPFSVAKYEWICRRRLLTVQPFNRSVNSHNILHDSISWINLNNIERITHHSNSIDRQETRRDELTMNRIQTSETKQWLASAVNGVIRCGYDVCYNQIMNRHFSFDGRSQSTDMNVLQTINVLYSHPCIHLHHSSKSSFSIDFYL